MTHAESYLLLAAGSALDDLTRDERADYDAHRAGCRECAVAEDELSAVVADLALVAPERLPPPDLLAGIRLAIDAEATRAGTGRVRGIGDGSAIPGPALAMETVATDTAVHELGGPVVPIQAARSMRRPLLATVGIAAVLALAVGGLGARSVGLQRDLDAATARVVSLQAELGDRGAVMAAAMNPAHVTVALHNEPLAQEANAVVMFVPGTDSSWIVAENLPVTPSGHGYQLWFADAQGVHGLQTVPYDGEGPFVGELGVDLAASSAVMITLEETGGAQGEPGPQVVFGEL
jgi:hypothetical protein